MGSWVHGSILRSALSIATEILPVLELERARSGVNNNLIVTGHSLGAGVASLVTLVLRRPKMAQEARQSSRTQGDDLPLPGGREKMPAFLADIISTAKRNADRAREAMDNSEAGSRMMAEAKKAVSAIEDILGMGEPWKTIDLDEGGFDARCFAFATPSCASPELAASPAFNAVLSVIHGDDVIPRSSEGNLLRLLLQLQRSAQSWSDRSKSQLTKAETEYVAFLEGASGSVQNTIESTLSQLREAHASLPEDALGSHGHEVERALKEAELDLKKKLNELREAAVDLGKDAFDGARKGVDEVLNEDNRESKTRGQTHSETIVNIPTMQELQIPGKLFHLQRRLRRKESSRGATEVAVPLDVYLGEETRAQDVDLEMYYRLLRAEQRAFQFLVISENMVTDHACRKYEAALCSAAGVPVEVMSGDQ